MSIGSALEDEAIRRGMSHREAGEVLGVSQATFSRWVNGTDVPASNRLTGIARFLHMPKDEVTELCARERTRRGARGVRRATDELAALRKEVNQIPTLRREIGDLRRVIDRIERHLGIEP